VNRFTGTWTLVRLILRKDRIRLPVWVGAIVGLVAVSTGSVKGLYDTPEAQASYAATVGTSTATVAMNGPPTALDTIGGISVYENSLTAIVGVALMAVFLTVRHTRGDEEAGRTELLRAGVLGRHADLAATGVVELTASVAVGAGVAGSFLAFGLPTSGSLIFGASVASVGVVFTAVALVAAQLASHARAAIGLSLTTLGVAYVVRAVGDVAENGLSWVSPIGWAQAGRAFADERWWPLLLAILFAVGLGLLAAWLMTQRDLGAGMLPERRGSASASRWLAGALGLAARLQRPSVIGWSVGLGLLGVAYGVLAEDIQDMIEGQPELERIFLAESGGASIVDAYFAVILTLTALVVTGFTISATLRLRTEEAAFRAEAMLATPLSRVRWTGSWLAVTIAGTVVVLGAAGLGTGLGTAAVLGDAGYVGSILLDSLTYLPATLILGFLGFALYGWFPRGGGVAWALLAICFVIGWLGELLSLPEWFVELSPYSQTPQVPLVDRELAPLVVLTGIALALVVVGLAGFRRRDLVTE
jgi:ABC-2 type transport system permease protein